MPPGDQNKTKDNESQNNREYVRKHLQEHEVIQEEPININAEEMDNEDMGAVQEKETGGRTLSDVMTNSGDHVIGGDAQNDEGDNDLTGMSNMVSSTDLTGLNTTGSGLNTTSTTELNETIGNAPSRETSTTSGDGMANPEDNNNTPLTGGFGDSAPNDNKQEGGSSNSGGGFTKTEEEDNAVNVNNATESTTEVEDLGNNITDDISKADDAKSELLHILNEVHKAEGRIDEKEASAGFGNIQNNDNQNIASGSGFRSLENTTPTVEESSEENNAETNSQHTENTTESAASKFMQDAGINEDLQSSESDTPDPQAIEKAEGQKEGLNAGRTAGLGKIVTTGENNELVIDKEEKDPKDIDAYVAETRAKAKEKGTNYYSGFSVGFNQGYIEGMRLKREAKVMNEQREANSDPEMVQGELDGTESGTKMNSKDGDEKSRAESLKSAVSQKSAKYKKAFYPAFNKAYFASRRASAIKKLNAPTELLGNKTFKKGYDLGHKIGMAEGRKVLPEGMSQEQVNTARKNASLNKDINGQDITEDKEKLYKKGFYIGLNKGFRQGRVALQGEKKKREEDLKDNDKHYKAGAITGILAGMFGKDKAMQVLTGGLALESLGQGLRPIPDEVIKYYENGEHLNQNSVDKKNYNVAYYQNYNRALYQSKQKTIQQKRKTETGSEEYKKGYSIGEVAGAAASIQHKYERQLYPLEQKKKAQEEAIKNTGSSEDKTNYDSLMQPLQEKINRIQGHLDQIKKALNAAGVHDDYKKGYHKAYNRAYLKEAHDRVKAKEAQRMNLGAQEKIGEQTSDTTQSASFAQGFAVGKEMGALFYQKRKEARGNADKTEKVNQLIEKAFKYAKTKDSEFTKGFFRGYNQTIFTGSGGGGQSMREKAKTDTAALEAQAKKYEDDALAKEYVNKGIEYAYKLHYEYGKTPAAARKGKKPQDQKEEYTKNLTKELQTDPKTKSKESLLLEAFENGYKIGEVQGKEHAELFLTGYKDGIAGTPKESSILSKYRHYQAGHKQGIKEAQYQNFRNAALSGPNSLVEGYDASESSTQIKLKGKSDHYKKGFELDYNNWLKIFWIASGQVAPKDMEGSLSLSYEDAINAEAEAKAKKEGQEFSLPKYDTELKRAKAYASQVDAKMEQVFEHYRKNLHSSLIQEHPDIKGKDLSENSDEYRKISNQIDEEIKSDVEDFKNGYKAAVADTKKQVEGKQNTDLAYTEGLLFGYKNNTSKTKDNGDPMLDYANLPKAIKELAINIEGKDQVYAQQGGDALIRFNEGRVRGLQLAQLVRTENISALDIMAELGGPRFQAGYKKGITAAKEAVDSYKGALEEGQATEKLIELREQATTSELEGEALKGYEAAYKYHFAKGKVFADGFHVAKFVATNDKADDDYNQFEYQLEKEDWKEFESVLIKEYRKGVVAGREAGLQEKYGNSEISKEVALQRRIAQLREQTNKAYGDAYEMGYTFGSQERNTENANIASIQARFELMGPAPLGQEIRSYMQNLLETDYEKLKEDLGKDEQQELLNAYKSIVEDFLPELLEKASNESKTPIENATTLAEGLSTKISSIDIKGFAEENKKNFLEQTKVWTEAAKSFKEGYIRGARKGVVEGINIKRANERTESGNIIDDFFNQMMNAVSNKGNTHYIKGYQQARANVHHHYKEDRTISQKALESKRFEVINDLRKDLHYYIQDNYDQLKNNTPSLNDKDGMAFFLEQKVGFRHISHHFQDEVELNMTEGQFQEDFIKNKEEEILKELQDLINSYDEKPNILKDDPIYKEVAERAKNKAVDYFKKQLETNWTNFIQRYNEGYKAGYSKGIQEVMQGQTEEAKGISSGEANDLIDRIYEELQAGRIEDGDIGDIDWLDKADLLLIEIQDQRETLALDKGLIYDSNEAIIDFMDEVTETELERSKIVESLDNTEDIFDELELELKLEQLDQKLLNLENQIVEEENNLNELQLDIEEQSNKFRRFLRDEVDFEASKTSNKKINDYLLREKNSLELDGSFSDTEGNAQVYHTGRLGIFDADTSWEIIGELLIGLGDLTLMSSGIYVHNEEYFVELEAGSLKVPLMEDNQVKELHFPFNYLELEMGIGMLEQINQQLMLDDALNAGSLLLSNVFDWG